MSAPSAPSAPSAAAAAAAASPSPSPAPAPASQHEAGRALLYTFSGSVWGSVPRIGLIEKGYAASDVEMRSVDLLKGENFAPTYLRVNSAGTVPTLVVPLAETTGREQDTKFRALTDSVAVLNFLDASRSQQLLSQKNAGVDALPAPALAPATIEGKAASDALIQLVHCAEADPNFLLLCARSADELAAQAGGLQGAFVKGRDEALQRYRAEAAANADTVNPREASQNSKLLAFYDDKIAAQAPLVGAYLQHDAGAIAGFVEASRKAWKALPSTLAKLETQLQGTYALGDQFSLADVHLMAWLARLLAVVKGLPGAPDDELEALDAALKHEVCGGTAVGPKLSAYWKTLKTRPSYAAVYGEGLH